jgi:uncharacterized membrane protein YhaH (DUF805 family)
MEWYLAALKKYADFSGRARRREYWMFVLVNLVISCVLAGLGYVSNAFNVLSYIYALAVLVPSFAVGWRRLHDTGRSGWWMLIGLIPLVGAIILIVFFLQDSAPGDNQYGPNPKLAPQVGAVPVA